MNLTFVLPIQTDRPDSADVFFRQGCFAIDYNFATHKCYFHATNLWTEQIPTTATPATVFYRQIFFHCPISAATRFPSLNTIPNPTVVHITFCELSPQLYVITTVTGTCPKGHLSEMWLCRFLNMTLNLTLNLTLTLSTALTLTPTNSNPNPNHGRI